MLSEWHLTPEYIFANWTDEKLNLMVEKLAERKQRRTLPPSSDKEGSVSIETLSAMSSGMVKVVRR